MGARKVTKRPSGDQKLKGDNAGGGCRGAANAPTLTVPGRAAQRLHLLLQPLGAHGGGRSPGNAGGAALGPTWRRAGLRRTAAGPPQRLSPQGRAAMKAGSAASSRPGSAGPAGIQPFSTVTAGSGALTGEGGRRCSLHRLQPPASQRWYGTRDTKTKQLSTFRIRVVFLIL